MPRLRPCEPRKQLAATYTKKIGNGARLAVRKQERVPALLQARALADEVQSAARARALALCTDERVG
jgi:hypothetical protein